MGMSEQEKNAYEKKRQELEELTIAVYIELMSDSRVDPKVRKEAADSVREALSIVPRRETGKTAPTNVFFNLGDGLSKAISGVDTVKSLLSRGRELPEPDDGD